MRAARKQARAHRRAQKEKARVARELERRRLQEEAEAEQRAHQAAKGELEKEEPKENEALQPQAMVERGEYAWEKID